MNYIEYPDGFFHGSAKNHGTDGLIMSGDCEQVVALFGNELRTDTLSFIVNSDELSGKGTQLVVTSDMQPIKTQDGKWLMIGADVDHILAIEPGTKMDLYNEEGGTVIGRFYVQTVRQISRKSIEIVCTDGVGMLAQMADHEGGIYSGQTAGDVIDEIFAGSGLTYEVGADVAAVELYGHLPRASRRENLAKILVATGASLYETEGVLQVDYIGSRQTAEISGGIYLDTGDVDYKTPATRVQVTEHSFYALQTDPEDVLFDNTAELYPAADQLVVFDEPCHDLLWNGAALDPLWPAGVNFAVVTGTGVLTGKPYTQTQRVIERATGATGPEKVVRLEDNGLVGVHNSDYVAQRLANYYKLPIWISFDYYDRTGALLPGTKLDFKDPFGAQRSGWLEGRRFALGNKTRAAMEIAVDWEPGPYGSNITTYKLFTEGGTWRVPDGVSSLLVVLGSGGDGGQGGYDGTDGEAAYGHASDPQPGEGGLGGQGGGPGKINVVQIPVAAGDLLDIYIGAAGAKGAHGGAPGTAGAASTITVNGVTYTSADGHVYANGYLNQKTGEIYGLPGRDGFAGADGGDRITQGGNVVAGSDAWIGGQPGISENHRAGTNGTYIMEGGGGSGAVFGHNGARGGDRRWDSVHDYEGGSGADAPDPDELPDVPSPASGGSGGNGGGGGGAGGRAWHRLNGTDYDETYAIDGDGGQGSEGTPGKDGGTGFVLAMYAGGSEDAGLNWIKFESASPFTLKTANNLKNWNGTLEWSTDGEVWQTWPGTTTIGGAEKLYIRGTGNTKITGGLQVDKRWILTGADLIDCTGNIMGLLDYATVAGGSNPEMAAYTFCELFYGQTLLRTCPQLPATDLKNYCYAAMLRGCTSLQTIPVLPAATLKTGCYMGMMQGCTSIKVAASQDGTYANPWRIPEVGAGTDATNATERMFMDTGGTFTGDPLIDTTYFTANETI